MASDIQNEMESKYPVSQWSRMTVADGNALNKKTIKPLIERDDFLADKISEFADLIDIESEQRELNDTAISAALDKEIKDRKDQFDAIEEEFSSEAGEREAADEELQEQIDNHTKLRASVETDVSGHVTYDEYTNFNNTYNTVHTYSGDWDNVSAINVGTGETATKLTDSEVTMVGNNHVSVTSNGSTITVASTGSVGSVSEPIYMKEDGTFDKCSNATAGKFGNAVISIQGDKASALCYVNNSITPTRYDRIDPEYISDYTAQRSDTGFVPFQTTTILDSCFSLGVNNAIIRFDSADINTSKQFTSKNILDLSIDVNKLEKYKMYTIDLVPLYLDTLPIIAKDYDWFVSYANLQYSISFVNNTDKPINFSSDEYSCKTYGYLYNVPAFGQNNRDMFLGTYDSDSHAFVLPNRSECDALLNEKWQLYVNDSTYNEGNSQTTDISMQTIQPHSELELYAPGPIVSNNNGIEYAGLYFEKLGSNRIVAIWSNVDQYDVKPAQGSVESHLAEPNIYRRQLSFMRGDDITEVAEKTVPILDTHKIETPKSMRIEYHNIDFYVANDYVTSCKPAGAKFVIRVTGKNINKGDYASINEYYGDTNAPTPLQKYLISTLDGLTNTQATAILTAHNITNYTSDDSITSYITKLYIELFYKTSLDVFDYDNVYAYNDTVTPREYVYTTDTSLGEGFVQYSGIKGLHVTEIKYTTKSGSKDATAQIKQMKDTGTVKEYATPVKFKCNDSSGYLRILRDNNIIDTQTDTDYPYFNYYDRKIIAAINNGQYTRSTGQSDYEWCKKVMSTIIDDWKSNTISYNIELKDNSSSSNLIEYSLTMTEEAQTDVQAYTLYFFSQATY